MYLRCIETNSVSHVSCVTAEFWHVCQRLGRKWAGRDSWSVCFLILSSTFPPVWLQCLSWIKITSTHFLQNESTEWVMSKVWLKYDCGWVPDKMKRLFSDARGPFEICQIIQKLPLPMSRTTALSYLPMLLYVSSVCLNCWWERWTAAPCSPCCPLRRAGWVNLFHRQQICHI